MSSSPIVAFKILMGCLHVVQLRAGRVVSRQDPYLQMSVILTPLQCFVQAMEDEMLYDLFTVAFLPAIMQGVIRQDTSCATKWKDLGYHPVPSQVHHIK